MVILHGDSESLLVIRAYQSNTLGSWGTVAFYGWSYLVKSRPNPVLLAEQSTYRYYVMFSSFIFILELLIRNFNDDSCCIKINSLFHLFINIYLEDIVIKPPSFAVLTVVLSLL